MSGVRFYGMRHYSPEIGRWTARDPINENGGANLYVFCEGAPTDLSDAVGLTAASDAIAWLTRVSRYVRGASSTDAAVSQCSAVLKLFAAWRNVHAFRYVSGDRGGYSPATRDVSLTMEWMVGPPLPGHPEEQALLNQNQRASICHELTHAADHTVNGIRMPPYYRTEGHAYHGDNLMQAFLYLGIIEGVLRSSHDCAYSYRESKTYWHLAWYVANFNNHKKRVEDVDIPLVAGDHSSYAAAYGVRWQCTRIVHALNLLVRRECCFAFTCKKDDSSYPYCGPSLIGTGEDLPSVLR